MVSEGTRKYNKVLKAWGDNQRQDALCNDEYKFENFGLQRQYYIIVWWYISHIHVGNWVKINEIMNAEKTVKCFCFSALYFWENCKRRNCFQHYNESSFTLQTPLRPKWSS